MDGPIPLIPKGAIKDDADITALINDQGYVLNSIHHQRFKAVIAAREVIGKHVSDIYRPVPNDFLRCLERAFEGERFWKALTLPTITPIAVVDRKFVIDFQPWEPIDSRQVALVRSRSLEDDLSEALGESNRRSKAMRERANYLIQGEFSLDDVLVDALMDVTLKQVGFDATIMLDEDGLVLDVYNLSSDDPPVPVGANFVDFMMMFDPDWRER